MIESSEVVRVADRTADDACIALWVAAVAARDGLPADRAVRERAAGKFAAERVALVVAPGEQRPRGFALVTAPGTAGPETPAVAAYLSLLAVDPDAQGAGTGRALLAAAVEAARAAGHPHCVLHALEDNAPALRLYRSAGFAPVGAAFPHALNGRPTRTYLA